MIKVGTDHRSYANVRNISGLPFTEVEVVRAPDGFRLPNYLYFKAYQKTHPYLLNLHYCAPWAGVDLLHLFNGIHLGSKPWFSTFETFLPRWVSYGKGNLEWGLKQLARPNCKGLFALSACTAAIQEDVMLPFPELSSKILPKIQVLHPPQAPLIQSWEEKERKDGVIRLVFAGADFFRKGGLPMLRAFDKLVKEGADLELTIVSSMNAGDYASKAGQDEIQEAGRLMERNQKRISHFHRLDHSATLSQFKRSDIGLLPTLADTYGYTVLEAQAAGCPVISTNVRALPEINLESCGWLIDLEKDHWGNAKLDTIQELSQATDRIEQGLVQILREICNNPEIINQKGLNALGRIQKEHDPTDRAILLQGHYHKAIIK